MSHHSSLEFNSPASSVDALLDRRHGESISHLAVNGPPAPIAVQRLRFDDPMAASAAAFHADKQLSEQTQQGRESLGSTSRSIGGVTSARQSLEGKPSRRATLPSSFNQPATTTSQPLTESPDSVEPPQMRQSASQLSFTTRHRMGSEQSTCLDLQRLACAFDSPPSPSVPMSASKASADLRFMFFSALTGPIHSASFESINLHGFSKSVSETLQSGPFWLNVCQPTPYEMMQITKAFDMHPLTDEDIRTPDTREKCEIFSNYYFVVIRTFEQDEWSQHFMLPITFYIVVFRECVVSFHFSPTPHAANVLARIDQLRLYGLHFTSDWINYALIDDITDGFMGPIRFIDMEVESIDDLVLILKESEQSDMLRRIGHARKKVNQLMRLLNTKADVVKTVITRCMERLAPDSETRLYLEDIHDHVITMTQNLSHYEKTLARSHSNYLAQISIEITQASNRTNDVVMRMTALASILVPLNVITGLWGMNVQVPGQDIEGLGPFFVIVMCMLIFAVSTFYVVKRANLV